jgi:transglutaminase-like putative cysteine protease
MGAVIDASTQHPNVIAATREACAGLAMDTPRWRKARAVFDWIKPRIRFMTDESILRRYYGLGPDVELLQKPELLLLFRRGDCDCFSMLTCSMLQCARVPCRLVTIAADSDTPGRYSHIYAAAVLESGELLPLDTSHGPQVGWEAPWCYRRQEWAS